MNANTRKVWLQSVPISLLILLGGLLVVSFAQDNPEPARPAAESQEAHPELQKIRDGINRVLEENARLKEENAQLRKENQQLRRLLAEKAAAGKASNQVTPPADGNQSTAASPGSESPMTYWLSGSNGQRHNSRCRYFKISEGRLCGPEEGKPCKLCGG